jgi:uncharacterized protein YfaP (DUF2135 family)
MKRWSAIACFGLVAAVALTTTAPAAGPSSGAAADGASAAKKGCKKGKKKSAEAAKKKKCKKKKKKPAPPPSSAVRATLTWDTVSDIDLVIYAPEGTNSRVGQSPNAIANSSFSADDTNGLGPETFTDLALQSNRQFTYMICMDDAMASADTVATLTYRRADGSTNTLPTPAGAIDETGEAVFLQPSGGPVPSEVPNPCT